MQREINSRNPWVILGCAWLMGLAMFTPIFSVPPIMHIITEELGLSNAQVGLIFSAPLIMLAAFAIPSGALADKIGIRKVAGIGIIIITVGSLLRGTSTSYVTLLAFTCLYGAGLGIVYPNLPKLVASWITPKRSGLATGIYSTGIMIGIALPLAITLPVIYPIGNTFQFVFYIWTIPAIVAAITWWIVIREPPRINIRIKPIGVQNNQPYKIWTNRNIWLVAIIWFLSAFTFYSWSGWTPELMVMKGASPELAALMTSVIIWVGIPVVIVGPWLSDKIGLRKPFIWSSFIILGLASLGAIYATLALNWPIMVVVGIASSVQLPILLALPTELVPAPDVGRTSGMMISIGNIGGLIGPVVAGYMIDISGTLTSQLILLIGLAAVATYLSFKLPETGHRVKK